MGWCERHIANNDPRKQRIRRAKGNGVIYQIIACAANWKEALVSEGDRPHLLRSILVGRGRNIRRIVLRVRNLRREGSVGSIDVTRFVGTL
jgi:hypothetical protein